MDNPPSQNKILKIFSTLAVITGAIYYTVHVIKDVLSINFSSRSLIITSCIIFIATIIISFFILNKINKPDTAQSRFLIRKWFLIPFCLISVLNIGVASYFLGATTHQSNKFTTKKNRVVLLLPLNEDLKSAYDDGVRQLIGFAEFLKSNPECTRNIEFALYDHSMNVDVAERIIKDEMDQGTKYFISTMSKVNLPLSKKFPEIVASYHFMGITPKLICAVTSAQTINITSDVVYRYYIRSQEEAKALANIGWEKKLETSTFIAVDDDYGHGAVEEFRKEWKGNFHNGIFVKSTMTPVEMEERIRTEIAVLPSNQRQAIFICHYGNGIDNAITALGNLNINSTVLATSTLSIYEWQKPIRSTLDKIEWYTCVPKYISPYTSQNDVIKNFTTYTIEKLVSAISDTSFNANWSKNKSPINLDVEWKDGDFAIPMRAAYKTEFLKQ